MASRPHSMSFSFSESEMPVRFGRYLLLRRKNLETVGENFLAIWGVDEGIDQLRIIRAIYPSIAKDKDFVALFTEESRALSQLSSSNVVRILEVGEESGIPFVTKEHVEGLTLERLLALASERGTGCHWELAAHIVSEMLRGLDYIHQREDVRGVPLAMRHGDVRPQNVLISFNGEVKLTDFSSSLYYIIDQMTNARFETERGIFAPPESKTGSRATVAGDLWGTAMVLLSILKGPVQMKDLTRDHDTAESLPSVAFQISDIPKRLNLFLARALHPDGQYRFQSAAEMRDALIEVTKEHATGYSPDDLAALARDLGAGDRAEEERFVRTMLGREPSITLDESTDLGKMTPGVVLDGKYHLLRLLGEGGMGQVFEAEHLGLEKRVAVKVLHERVLHDAVAVERFRREAKIMGGLGHPNIVDVMDYGITEDGSYYLAMTLLDGVTLGEKISSEGTIAARELVEIMIPVCHGLSAAHEAGVIHRDLKPDNIFLTEKGPRIVDFGIAKREDLEDEDTSLTRTGNICGTVEYIAPEQLRGKSVDQRVDIYTVGLIMYEALTGKTPFKGRNIAETMHRVMTDRIVPPRKRTGDMTIPREVEDICLKAMARAPEKRYQTVAALAQALEATLPVFDERRSVPGLYDRRHRNISIAVAAVALAGIGGMVILLSRLPDKGDIAEVPASRAGAVSTAPALSRGGAEGEPMDTTSAQPGSPPERDATTSAAPEAEEPALPPIPESASVGMARAAARAPAETARADAEAKARDFVGLADTYLLKGDFAAALKFYKDAAKINPKEPKAWYGQGRAAFEQGDNGKAIKAINHALRLNPGRYKWRNFLGKIHMAAGDRDQAVREWRRVLKTNPTDQTAKRLLKAVGVDVN